MCDTSSALNKLLAGHEDGLSGLALVFEDLVPCELLFDVGEMLLHLGVCLVEVQVNEGMD